VSAIVAGARPDAAEAAHVLDCRTCRAALAERDPSALFALLGAVPPPVTAPALAELELPAAPGRAGAAPARVARLMLAAAAALLAAAALVPLVARRAPEASETLIATRAASGLTAPVVRRVDQPGARIVTLLPPSPDAPSVTMILGTELDL
jgi:hypothetical protein